MDQITITQKFRDPIIINCQRNVNYRDTRLLEERLPLTRKLIQINMELEEFKKEYPCVEALSKLKTTPLEPVQKEIVGIFQDLKFAIRYLNLLLYGSDEPPPPPPPPRMDDSMSGSGSDSDSDEYGSTEEIPAFSIVQPIPIRTTSLPNEENESYSYSSSSSEEPDNYYI